MSSTNKTTHYDLSQYTANDKPTYLVDYNADMSAIDSGIYAAKSEADTNTTAIGTLSNLNTTEKTNLVGAINEVNTQVGTNTGNIGTLQTSVSANTGNIGTMANLDTTDKTSLVNAINEVKTTADQILEFNLSESYTLNSPTSVQGCTYLDGSLTLMTNADKSIFKLYGGLRLHLTSQSGGQVKATFTAPLNPSADYTISPFCLVFNENGTVQSMGYVNINANGTITVGAYLAGSNGENPWFYATPCIYFNKDFGDQPTPNA